MLPALAVPLFLALFPAALAPEEGADPIRLAFAWPAAGSVAVREERELLGKVTAFSYRLSWTSEEGTGNRIVAISDVAVTSYMGLSALGAKAHPSALAQAPLLAAVPVARIDGEGKYLGPTGVAETLEDVRRALGAVKSEDPERQLATEQAVRRVLMGLNQERFVPDLEAAEREKWNVWLGCWLGFAVAEGETAETRTGSSDAVEIVETRRCAGTSEREGMTCATVAYTRVESGAAMGERARDELQRRSVRAPAAEEVAAAMRRVSIDGTLEVATLRPLAIDVSDTVEIRTTKADRPVTHSLLRRYRFTWPPPAAGGEDR
ncbi:MAG: hypothetical protein AB1726_13730 [Planctomycetota bacterium]